MNRRQFLATGVAALGVGHSSMTLLPDAYAVAEAAPQPFSRTWLIEEAGRLSTQPHQARQADLPAAYADLGYDAYHDIRFKPEATIWSGEASRFRLEPLHAGFLYQAPVDIFLVRDGQATLLPFSSSLFSYGRLVEPPADDQTLFYTGFRVRTPLNAPDFWDEILIFQGASYFRAVATGLIYGISARGLANKVGDPDGEEFPTFTQFWIEQPHPDATSLVIHALLESPTATGAYRFSVRPGDMTVMDVEVALFLREDSGKIGFAPLTSMFLFGDVNRSAFDDFREGVHDSDGLKMITGAGEHLWRPITNPSTLGISWFGDLNPLGFGLIQRSRRVEDFEDLQAHYERRPSLWVQPIGDWGAGSIVLVEIPTRTEFNDNIVAYWRPDDTLAKGGPYTLTYRLFWCALPPDDSALAPVMATRTGQVRDGAKRQFVIDFGALPDGAERVRVEADASAGEISDIVGRSSNVREGYRVSFVFDPGDAELAELGLRLVIDGKAVSEKWLFQWKP